MSPDEPRLRAGWRLVLQSLLALVLLFAFTLPIVIGLMLAGAGSVETLQGFLLLNALPSLLGIVASVWIARRFFDLRSFSSLGLDLTRRAAQDVAAGIAIAAVMMGAILLLEIAIGWTRLEGWAWQTTPGSRVMLELVVALLLFVAVGIQEEILSRGYHLQNIKDGTNLLWGVILSSAVFAALHIGNPNSIWYTTILGLFAAGVFLAYGWVRTRALWLPIGLHIGWNLFEGPVFGFPVSGLATSRLLVHTVNGPPIWTGGAFGPEAGLIILPAMVLGSCLVWAYTRGRRLRQSDAPTPRPAAEE